LFKKLKPGKHKSEIETTEETLVGEISKEPSVNSKKLDSTFTLRITDDGKLVGLAVDKPKPHKSHRNFFSISMFKRKKEEKETEDETKRSENDVKTRLKSIFKHKRAKEGKTKKEETKSE